MNEVRRELERAHEAHTAAEAEQPLAKKRRLRDLFKRAWLRRTSTSR
jgi:hypothetical protein